MLIRSYPILFQELKQGTGLQDATTLRVGSAPWNALWFPMPVALLGMQQQWGCRTHPEQQSPWEHRAQPAVATPAAGRASPAKPVQGQQGTKQCLHPWERSMGCCSPQQLLLLPLHESTRNYGDNFVHFPLSCKSGLKAAKTWFSQLEEEFVKLKACKGV